MSSSTTRRTAGGGTSPGGAFARLVAYADRASLANRRMGGCPCTLPAALGFAFFPKARLCKPATGDDGPKDDDLFGAGKPGFLA